MVHKYSLGEVRYAFAAAFKHLIYARSVSLPSVLDRFEDEWFTKLGDEMARGWSQRHVAMLVRRVAEVLQPKSLTMRSAPPPLRRLVTSVVAVEPLRNATDFARTGDWVADLRAVRKTWYRHVRWSKLGRVRAALNKLPHPARR